MALIDVDTSILSPTDRPGSLRALADRSPFGDSITDDQIGAAAGVLTQMCPTEPEDVADFLQVANDLIGTLVLALIVTMTSAAQLEQRVHNLED